MGVQDFDVSCTRCGSDLQVIAVLHELPDAQFNQALQSARQGDWSSAMIRLGAVLSLRMGDVEAWLLTGTLYARRGMWEPARECFSMALMFQPGEPRAQEGLASIDRILKQADEQSPEA
jgi:Flp pilus assembly protein TadD